MRSHPSRPRGVRRPRAAVRLVALLLAALFVAACSTGPDVRAEDTDPGDVALVVVGDSLTAGSGSVTDGEAPGEGSWVPAALGEPVVLAGGWAVRGATTADMREGVAQVRGDVLVVMAGTNDVAQSVDWATGRDDLLAITRTVHVDTVVVSAIPPLDDRPEASVDRNERLRQLAAEQGWTFLDPWEAFGQDGTWVAGASPDGVHPTQEVADEVGRTIRAAVLARAPGG